MTVRIDRIVLEGLGVSPGRADALRARVETELRRLLEHDPPAGGGGRRHVRRVDGAALDVGVGAADEGALARQLAVRIAQSLRA